MNKRFESIAEDDKFTKGIIVEVEDEFDDCVVLSWAEGPASYSEKVSKTYFSAAFRPFRDFYGGIFVEELQKAYPREKVKTREYILVRESIDVGHAMLAVGHGVLAAHREFSGDPDYDAWLNESFRKCVCSLSDAEFEEAKKHDKRVLMTESGLDGAETALVFCPRSNDEWPKEFKRYKLWGKTPD